MKKSKGGIKVSAGVKAGGMFKQHNRGIRVRAGLKAGGMRLNHNRRALRV
jgi:hypothetical protein